MASKSSKYDPTKNFRAWYHPATLEKRIITFDTFATVCHHLLNPTLLLALGISLVTTYFCLKNDWRWDPHISLLVTPLVFPLAFSINSNYTRREKVLDELANFKAAAVITYWCHRDWAGPAQVGGEHAFQVKERLERLVDRFFMYMRADDLDARIDCLSKLYAALDQIAAFTEIMRSSRLESSGPLVTRLIHYHNLMCASIEKIRVVRDYRTPRSIRDLIKILTFVFPIFTAPYYVEIAHKTGQEWNAYYTAVVVSLMFGSLQSASDGLDSPFDGVGHEDDVDLNQLALWKRTIWLPTSEPDPQGRFRVSSDEELGFDPFEPREPSLSALSLQSRRGTPDRAASSPSLEVQPPPVFRRAEDQLEGSIQHGASETSPLIEKH